MKNSVITAFFFCVTICLVSSTAYATLSFEFTGSGGNLIDSGNLVGGNASGLNFSGEFFIDPAEVDSTSTFIAGDAEVGNHTFNAPLLPIRFSLLVNGITISADDATSASVSVNNRDPGGSIDVFQFIAQPKFSGIGTAGHPISHLIFTLHDDTSTVFDDVDIPDALPFGAFSLASVNIQYRDPANAGNVLIQFAGNLTTLTAVPEASAMLCGLCLAGLSVFRRPVRRWARHA